MMKMMINYIKTGWNNFMMISDIFDGGETVQPEHSQKCKYLWL